MVSLDARPTFGTITRIVGTLALLLAPFSVPALTAGAPAPDSCRESALPDSGSSPRTMDRSVGSLGSDERLIDPAKLLAFLKHGTHCASTGRSNVESHRQR
jgi:hypothetical protein